jgi:hypothetical protein
LIFNGINAIGEYVHDSIHTPVEETLVHQPRALKWWEAQIKSACSPSAGKTEAWVFKEVGKVLAPPHLLRLHIITLTTTQWLATDDSLSDDQVESTTVYDYDSGEVDAQPDEPEVEEVHASDEEGGVEIDEVEPDPKEEGEEEDDEGGRTDVEDNGIKDDGIDGGVGDSDDQGYTDDTNTRSNLMTDEVHLKFLSILQSEVLP